MSRSIEEWQRLLNRLLSQSVEKYHQLTLVIFLIATFFISVNVLKETYLSIERHQEKGSEMLLPLGQ